MGETKGKALIYISALIFLAAGVYLTFFKGSTNKFDSEAKAYRIYPNESRDIDGNSTYNPIYYFNVNGREYECKSTTGSSSYPNESKNTVYYDSKDPDNCKTEYDKSSGKVAGIICLVATAAIVYFFIIRKPTQLDESNLREGTEYQVDEEKAQKVLSVINKAQLIYKRIVLGVFIVILVVLILIETAILKQTIKAKDYIDTTATMVSAKESEEADSIFDDYIYTFEDQEGKTQEIVISISKGEEAPNEKLIKYNPSNPQEFYEEGATLDKSGIIWYIVKVVALILLVILFFSKKILSKIGISFGNSTTN